MICSYVDYSCVVQIVYTIMKAFHRKFVSEFGKPWIIPLLIFKYTESFVYLKKCKYIQYIYYCIEYKKVRVFFFLIFGCCNYPAVEIPFDIKGPTTRASFAFCVVISSCTSSKYNSIPFIIGFYIFKTYDVKIKYNYQMSGKTGLPKVAPLATPVFTKNVLVAKIISNTLETVPVWMAWLNCIGFYFENGLPDFSF